VQGILSRADMSSEGVRPLRRLPVLSGEEVVAAEPEGRSPAPLGTKDVGRKLDLARKLYQRSIYPSARAVAGDRRLPGPLVVDLDPTTACDLACPECISQSFLHTGQFSGERIVTLAEELVQSGVKAVILIGGGEPLLHRSIGVVIDRLHAAGIALGLVTNGTLIGRYLDQLSRKLSWIRVSVDAATAATYDRFRPSGRPTSVFPLVIEQMRQLAGRKAGKLGYSFLLMQRLDGAGRVLESNHHEVYQAGALARSIGCDYFELKAMFDESHFVMNRPAEEIARVEEQVARLQALEDDSFRVLGAMTWEVMRRGLAPVEPKDYGRCRIIELRTTVTPNGVFVCPSHRGRASARLGDVREMSFAQMWAAADTTIVDPRRDCRFHCARHGSNLAIEELTTRQGAVELHDDYDPFV
jgi:hypothetical protein